MERYLWVGLGGCVGSIARFALASVLATASESRAFPLGTLAANLIGCLLIGGLAAALLSGTLHPSARFFLVVGLLGGFTTFSSFGLESLQMLQSGRWPALLGYIAGSVVGGLGLTALGWQVVRLLTGPPAP